MTSNDNQRAASVAAATRPGRLDCIDCGEPHTRVTSGIAYCTACGATWPARYAADTTISLTVRPLQVGTGRRRQVRNYQFMACPRLSGDGG